MEAKQVTIKKWTVLSQQLGKEFAKRAKQFDSSEGFVKENYEELKKCRFFSAMIPLELGGGGLSYTEMCQIIKSFAENCGSTALAFSMHQHLTAATIWKYKNKGLNQSMLENIAKDQLVLISTGAKDWLDSNGQLKETKGGYLFTAKKYFASQSVIGDIAVTSAPVQQKNGKSEVLHFSVPMKSEGVSVLNDWRVMGMRGTGSQTIQFDQVFISKEKIALTRPQGTFHTVWNVVLTVAMPLIMSAYIGIAERATKIALQEVQKRKPENDTNAILIGRLNNQLLSAQVQWEAMYKRTNNFEFTPSDNLSVEILSLKTNVANLCRQIVTDAMEIVGGQSFYQKHELERLFRDVQAAQFHPLPQWDQYLFSGKKLLKNKREIS